MPSFFHFAIPTSIPLFSLQISIILKRESKNAQLH
ncbi:hypothetical protein BRIN106911_12165 [Brevibacillus invocatus]